MNYKTQCDKLLELCGLDYEELGNTLGVSRMTVYRWRKNGLPEPLFLFLVAFCNMNDTAQRNWKETLAKTLDYIEGKDSK